MRRLLDRTSFRALGTTCTMAVSASPLDLPLARRAAAAARAEVQACESVLSRFDPESDVSRVNAEAGCWVGVDARLIEALAAALLLRDATDGACDPTLLHALAAAGYDRSYELLDDRPPRPAQRPCGDVDVDRARRRVRISPDAAIDLGAVAKGWIAQRALGAAALAWPRLPGAVLDLGGDVAVTGEPPEGGRWRVDVEDPRRLAGSVGTLRVGSGGVATSGPLRRRFGPGGTLHHLIDPVTLAPAAEGPVSATVVATDPVTADAHATALAILPVDRASPYVARRPGLGAVLVLAEGPALVLGELDFVAAPTRKVAV